MGLVTQEGRKERLDRGIKVRTEGIYAVSSWEEVSYLILPRLILIVGLLLLPIVAPTLYLKRVASIASIYALLALGFDFLAHYVGLVSLGGAFFIGVGGYTAALLNKTLELSPLFTLPMATVGGGLIFSSTELFDLVIEGASPPPMFASAGHREASAHLRLHPRRVRGPMLATQRNADRR